jgi:hypothetical protein
MVIGIACHLYDQGRSTRMWEEYSQFDSTKHLRFSSGTPDYFLL